MHQLEEDLLRCMKCGDCQAVCPTFEELGRETAVARGKVRLIRAVSEGDLGLTKNFAEKISACLMCKACVANCPSGVKVDQIIETARQKLVEERGLPTSWRIIFTLLRHPLLLAWGLKSAYPLIRFSHRNIPAPARKTLGEQLPMSKVQNPKMKVAFFAGCLINHIYTDIGKATVDVLKENSIEVVIKKEKCCGIPALYSGDIGAARALAEWNVDLFYEAEVEAIVTSCPTCLTAWKEYPRLFEDETYAKAMELSKKVYDISEFLVDIINFKRELGEIKERITYHDPCHLNYGWGITDAPREIIKAVPGAEFVEMRKPGSCCGFGGMFSLDHYALSTLINDKKIGYIKDTKAQIVLTGCPGCMLHLEDGFKRQKMHQMAMHTVQLLDRAYKAARG